MEACKSLSQVDQAVPLGAEDLELLATSAYMIGRDDDLVGALERAHHLYLDSGEALRAVRCACCRHCCRARPVVTIGTRTPSRPGGRDRRAVR
jgi:hypothetical protein